MPPLKTPICDFGNNAKNFQLNSTINRLTSLNDVKGETGTLVMFYNLENKKVKNLGENWIASNASIIGDVTLEKNISIWFNVTLRGDVENIHIGEGSNVQDGSVLHTDPGYPLKIGKDVTIGHLVMLHGCSIGNNSLIGLGAVILNGAKIGNNCIIGANALITENKVIPDNSLVLGSPGKIVRQVSNEEAKLITENAIHYQDNWKKYIKSIF
jgi:carbonic anhydrase/acetyltransferase-like protein (isoleucine patch superfamily)